MKRTRLKEWTCFECGAHGWATDKDTARMEWSSHWSANHQSVPWLDESAPEGGSS